MALPTLALLQSVLVPERHPICIIDYKTTGGSAIYGKDLAKKLCAEGHAVLYIVQLRKERRLEATLMYGATCGDVENAGTAGKGSTPESSGHAVPASDHNSLEHASFEGHGRWTFSLYSLKDLIRPEFPRFERICVNDLVNWTLPFWEGLFVKGNGSRRGKYLGEVLRQIVHLAEVHRADLWCYIHDYYSLCPSPHLINTEGDFCGLPESLEVCQACMPKSKKHRGISLARWREDWQVFFNHIDHMVIVSESALAYLERVFSIDRAKVSVESVRKMHTFSRAIDIPAEGPMVVAIAGDITVHKGSRIVMELANLMAMEYPQARIVIAGSLDTGDAGSVPPNVTVTGAYAVEELLDRFEKYGCTVGFFSSIHPETFSMVTQELMQLELPLVCFPLGAPQKRVSAWEKGLVANAVSARAALDALVELDKRRLAAISE